jgi:MFS family permease
MFGSYFFDDMFSTVSFIFKDPSLLELGWNSTDYGFYAGGYSTLCVFGGLVLCGILLDKWGVRITGSIFVAMMIGGAALVYGALRSGAAPGKSLAVAYTGCMLFGLGSEIAGTAVNRSIAKWFKGGNMALAMGVQLSIARLGSATAMVVAPMLIVEKPGAVYSLAETASPAFVGLMLLLLGGVLWAVFVAMDARFDARRSALSAPGASVGMTEKEDEFHLSDVWKVLTNKNFLLVALLCVFFYSSIISFKKFGGAILVPRFNISATTAGWMVASLPFSTVIFAPLFGLLVDKFGKGTRWMIAGSILAVAAHLLLAFAPQGVPFWGYLSMALLGFGYSLVPAALWPSLPKIVPEKALGTAFALTYWVQNLGLMLFKTVSGKIFDASGEAGPVHAELMFIGLAALSIVTALLLALVSKKNPQLGLDRAAGR